MFVGLRSGDWLGAGMIGQRRDADGLDQCRWRGLRCFARAHRVQHAGQLVGGVLRQVKQITIDLQLAIAQQVEHFLHAVTQIHQRLQMQKARSALDGVEATEDRIQQFTVLRALLKLHQLIAKTLSDLAGLDQEVVGDVVLAHTLALAKVGSNRSQTEIGQQ